MGRETSKVSCLVSRSLVSFKQGRLHLDAFDTTQLACEGTYLIGGTFKDDRNNAVSVSWKTLAADDDARMAGEHRVDLGRGFPVFHINKDCAYSPFHLNDLRIR